MAWDVSLNGSGAAAACAANSAAKDVRGQTLDRIGDLLSRLPEAGYFSHLYNKEGTPSAALQSLDNGWPVSVYKDDGKRAGWFDGYRRRTAGDEPIARFAGNDKNRRASVEQLETFERALKAHLMSAGLMPRE